jgi:hypothetical protein
MNQNIHPVFHPTLKSKKTAYRRFTNKVIYVVERVMGIEPTLLAWKAKVLPLNYTRIL